jgi:hypothetical protein
MMALRTNAVGVVSSLKGSEWLATRLQGRAPQWVGFRFSSSKHAAALLFAPHPVPRSAEPFLARQAVSIAWASDRYAADTVS